MLMAYIEIIIIFIFFSFCVSIQFIIKRIINYDYNLGHDYMDEKILHSKIAYYVFIICTTCIVS